MTEGTAISTAAACQGGWGMKRKGKGDWTVGQRTIPFLFVIIYFSLSACVIIWVKLILRQLIPTHTERKISKTKNLTSLKIYYIKIFQASG